MLLDAIVALSCHCRLFKNASHLHLTLWCYWFDHMDSTDPIDFHYRFGNLQFHQHLKNTDFGIRVVREENASMNEDYLNKSRPLNKHLGVCT